VVPKQTGVLQLITSFPCDLPVMPAQLFADGCLYLSGSYGIIKISVSGQVSHLSQIPCAALGYFHHHLYSIPAQPDSIYHLPDSSVTFQSSGGTEVQKWICDNPVSVLKLNAEIPVCFNEIIAVEHQSITVCCHISKYNGLNWAGSYSFLLSGYGEVTLDKIFQF